ncbi:zinc transporter 7 [Quercus suber]|uniref:Zinc transporter 7 n=1 Tax=Quercus suber TaxID=58331 RepID=A0AAW0M9H1_QUESU
MHDQADYKLKMNMIMVATPFGITLGLCLSNMYSENNPTALIVVGVLNAASTGILNYMALVNFLAIDFIGSKLQQTVKLQMLAFLAIRAFPLDSLNQHPSPNPRLSNQCPPDSPSQLALPLSSSSIFLHCRPRRHLRHPPTQPLNKLRSMPSPTVSPTSSLLARLVCASHYLHNPYQLLTLIPKHFLSSKHLPPGSFLLLATCMFSPIPSPA